LNVLFFKFFRCLGGGRKFIFRSGFGPLYRRMPGPLWGSCGF